MQYGMIIFTKPENVKCLSGMAVVQNPENGEFTQEMVNLDYCVVEGETKAEIVHNMVAMAAQQLCTIQTIEEYLQAQEIEAAVARAERELNEAR